MYSYNSRQDHTFLQRVSIACYAERSISYDRFRPSIARPSLCHTLVSCENDSSYDRRVFTVG